MKSLTQEELRLLPSFYERRWAPIARLTGPPTDPDAAFEAVAVLCRRARRPAPKEMKWIDGNLNYPQDERCTANRRCAHCMASWLMTRVGQAELAPGILTQIHYFDRSWSSRALIRWRDLHRHVPRHHDSVVFTQVTYPVVYDFFDQIGWPGYEIARPWREICLQASAFWFNGPADREMVIFVKHPSYIVRNEQGQIGNADGPAIGYANGDVIYAWRDRWIERIVQPRYLEQQGGRGFVRYILDGIVDEIQSSILIDMYGPARFLDEVPNGRKRILDMSKWGILWEVEGTWQRRLFVQVKNSSGRREDYVIPVDPFLRPLGRLVMPSSQSRKMTARQAIASTFGLEAGDYERIVQS